MEVGSVNRLIAATSGMLRVVPGLLARRQTGSPPDVAGVAGVARADDDGVSVAISAAGRDAAGTSDAVRSAGQGDARASQEQVRELAERDREVRAHEQAHLAAAGPYARGGAQYDLTRGPDGRQYATGGSVSIDTSAVSGDPETTIEKMQQVRAASLAPSDPSPADRRIAAKATQVEAQARAETRADEPSDESSAESSAGTVGGERSASAYQRSASAYQRSAPAPPTGRVFDVRV